MSPATVALARRRVSSVSAVVAVPMSVCATRLVAALAAAGLVVAGLIYSLADILAPFLAAAILAYILDPANKREVGEVLKKNLRLSKDEDVDASYRVSRLQMPDLDVAPNLEAWRVVKRLVAKVNPKVADVDLEQVINTAPAHALETSGFMAEMSKRLPK